MMSICVESSMTMLGRTLEELTNIFCSVFEDFQFKITTAFGRRYCDGVEPDLVLALTSDSELYPFRNLISPGIQIALDEFASVRIPNCIQGENTIIF